MFAKLTASVFGGYSFPYNLEEPYDTAWGNWTHYPGEHKDDKTPVSVFKLSVTDPNDRKLVIARNGVKRLKLLRHPNILAFKDSIEATEKGATVLYLVTERVKPLQRVLEELNLQGQHRDEYLAMGILHMTKAISFINNDCKMIHGNICLTAVVVTETLDWKLHGFDLLTEHTLPPDNCLQHAAWMVGNQYKPAELGKPDWDAVAQGPPWAVDAWGLGCLMQEVFYCQTMSSIDNLRRTDEIPKGLLPEYQKLLSSMPSRRLNPAKVAECKFLNNRLVDVVHFMENVAVKDSIEKDSFFKRLPTALPSIPNAVAVRKLLPMISSALEFGGAPASAVSSLLQIGNTLSADEFAKRVVPCMSKLFASQDRNLRRNLLESIDSYGPHMSTATIEEQIYPHLSAGFNDSNAYIRELTLKSILTLAPKMTNKTLTQSVLKFLSKLQVDEEPSIRANTTVLLGNIAQYLGEATCKRVLLNAFTRALKDAFPPARIAGLRALTATVTTHSPEEAATRIVPTCAPLAIDPVREVRQAAIQCLEVFTKVLRDYDTRLGEEAAAQAAAAGEGGPAAAAAGAGAPTIGAGSMLTWAVSGLMSTVTRTAGAKPSAVTAPAAAAGAAASSSSEAPIASPMARTTSDTMAATRSGSNSSFASASSKLATAQGPGAAAPPAAAGGAGDGWGDGDGWDEDELDLDHEAEMRARQRLGSNKPATTTASRAAPTTTTAPSLNTSSSRGNSGGGAAGEGWNVDEDEVWEDMGMAAPAPAAAARPRPPSARPAAAAERRATGGSGGGAAPAKKPMKLGVQKLAKD